MASRLHKHQMRNLLVPSIFSVFTAIWMLAPNQTVEALVPSQHKNHHRVKASCRQSVVPDKRIHCNDRRSVLQRVLMGSVLIISPSSTRASETGATDVPPTEQASAPTKPYASLDALLPAARVKLVIDRCVTISSELVNNNNSNTDTELLVQELQQLLSNPQNYTRSEQLANVPKQPAQQYLDTYKKNVDRLNVLEKPGGLLVQAGEIDTWKRLKRQERNRESLDEIRAAFNTYTSSLSFSGDSYRLNVPKEERSRMIRQDSLPDVKNVIASDMGMRYLYRNEILTSMEDARAEMQYQLQQDDFDAHELLSVLKNAQQSCNQWFSLIDEGDVQAAMNVAMNENPKR